MAKGVIEAKIKTITQIIFLEQGRFTAFFALLTLNWASVSLVKPRRVFDRHWPEHKDSHRQTWHTADFRSSSSPGIWFSGNRTGI